MTNKRYYVDFYDFIDGWGVWGFYTDRLFDNIKDAQACCHNLQSKLADGNKSCGEHYGVIDRKFNREVFCGSKCR